MVFRKMDRIMGDHTLAFIVIITARVEVTDKLWKI